MSQSKRTALRLTVDLARQPIEGEVQKSNGPVHPVRRMARTLFGALEQAASEAADEPTTEEDPDHAA